MGSVSFFAAPRRAEHQARALNGINGATYSSAVPSTLEYYHIELDTHGLIYANGMWCEAYVNHIPRKELTPLWSEDGLQLEKRNIVEMTVPRIQYRRQIPNEILKFLENKVASHTSFVDSFGHGIQLKQQPKQTGVFWDLMEATLLEILRSARGLYPLGHAQRWVNWWVKKTKCPSNQ